MFIDPGKVKRVEVNKDNVTYYNNIFEEMRSEESKKKQAERILQLQQI